jgi:hypothetical protein
MSRAGKTDEAGDPAPIGFGGDDTASDNRHRASAASARAAAR